jgi:hypothetical protein
MNLDVEVEASGFGKGESRKLEEYMEVFGVGCEAAESDDDDDVEEEEEEEEEDDDDDNCTEDENHQLDSPDPRRNEDHDKTQTKALEATKTMEDSDHTQPTELSDEEEEEGTQSDDESDNHSTNRSNIKTKQKKKSNKNHAQKVDLDEEEIKTIVIKKMQRLKASNFNKHHTKKSVKHSNHSTPLGSKFKNDVKSLCSTEF